MTLPHEIPPGGAAARQAAAFGALVPAIETARLRLRAPCIGDFPAYADIACSERGRGIGGPMSRADAWADFAMMCAGWLLRGHGLWSLDRRDNGALAGFVLLGFEPGDQAPELGFMLCADAEGQGLAFEAATAARDHARTLGLPGLVSYVARDNHRSSALARRLGGRPDPSALPAGADDLAFRYFGAGGAA